MLRSHLGIRGHSCIHLYAFENLVQTLHTIALLVSSPALFLSPRSYFKMHKPRLLLFISCLQVLPVCRAASPQPSDGQDTGLLANLTYPPFSPASLNV